MLADPLPKERMYIAVQLGPGRKPRYVAIRGTSQLEGYHKHLADLLVGTNYSAVLAGALITMFNFRWVQNIARCASAAATQPKQQLCSPPTVTRPYSAQCACFVLSAAEYILSLQALCCCWRAQRRRP